MKMLLKNLLSHVRILFLLFSFVHLFIVAIITLNIDTGVDDDPKVQAYTHIRWKLLTCWFNLVTLAYLPTRLYCEWHTTFKKKKTKHVELLKQATDVVFTSIIVPCTVFADATFWTLYLTDCSILAPVRLFDYMPLWAQHSVHTISFITVSIDLMLMPRSRATSNIPHITLFIGFQTIYFGVMYYNLWQGTAVYAFLERISIIEHIIFLSLAYITTYVIFKLQWIVIDARWGKRRKFD